MQKTPLQRSIHRDPRTWALALVYVLYVVTFHHGVGGLVNKGDSAKFQFIGVIAGVSHPPGNPLYMLLDVAAVHLFFFVPAATVVTAISTACGLGALAMLGRATTILTGSKLAGAVTIVVVGLGPTFWTLSTEAEVYTLNALLLSTMLFYAARYLVVARTKGRDARALRASLCWWMVAFSNHLTVVGLVLAFGFLVVDYVRAHGVRAMPRLLLAPALVALVSASLYAYVPVRVAQHASYSEFADPLGVRSVWQYVTAQQFHDALSWPSLRSLASARMPTALAGLQRQWTWFALIGIAWGMVVMARRHPRALLFFVLGATGLLVFPLVYRIGDPDGFYLPVIVLAGVPLGASVLTFARPRAPLEIAVALLLSMIPLATGQIVTAWKEAPQDRVLELEDLGVVGWDLPDIVQRVPANTRFLAPCGDYGCSEILNYYRFADRDAKAKGFSIAHLPGKSEGWHALWPEIAPSAPGDVSAAPICTLLPSEADTLRHAGVPMTEIARSPLVVRKEPYRRPSLFCSRR